MRQVRTRLAVLAFAAVPAISALADSLSGFDYAKGKQLTEERRQQYEVVFFNDVTIWQYNSNRYLSESQATSRKEQIRAGATRAQRRFEEFEAMANDGYMLAYAALRLLHIRKGAQVDDPAALDLLIVDYAESGHSSSMCALRAIQLTTATASKAPRYEEAAARLTEEGAKRGHPACLLTKSDDADTVRGRVSSGNRLRKLKPLLLPAAAQGFYRAHELFL